MKKRIKITALASILTVTIIGGTAIVPVMAADENAKEEVEISWGIPDEKETYKCDRCGKVFDTEEELNKHKSNSKEDVEVEFPIPDKTYKCDRCGEVFDTEEELNKHKSNSKEEVEVGGDDWDLNCPNCGEFVLGTYKQFLAQSGKISA